MCQTAIMKFFLPTPYIIGYSCEIVLTRYKRTIQKYRMCKILLHIRELILLDTWRDTSTGRGTGQYAWNFIPEETCFGLGFKRRSGYWWSGSEHKENKVTEAESKAGPIWWDWWQKLIFFYSYGPLPFTRQNETTKQDTRTDLFFPQYMLATY